MAAAGASGLLAHHPLERSRLEGPSLPHGLGIALTTAPAATTSAFAKALPAWLDYGTGQECVPDSQKTAG